MNLLLLVTLSFTAPSYGLDTLDCRQEDRGAVQNIVSANVYRALCGGSGMPLFQFSISVVNGGRYSFDVPDQCASWFVTGVNRLGKESRLECTQGYTVGVPLSVDPRPMLRRPGYFDIQGRRIRPGRSGRYFSSTGRDTTVLH